MNEIESIDAVLNPSSIAVIGASEKRSTVGHNILESLISWGFSGPIYPVNPKYSSILGLKVYRSIEEAPAPVDLAVIALNAHDTLNELKRCGKTGVKGAVCIGGGFKEVGPGGDLLEQDLIATAEQYAMRLIGPNTLGFINSAANINTSFYPFQFEQGDVSILSQSGGLGFHILYKMADYGLGIAKWVGVGNRAGLDFAQMIPYLAQDKGTAAIGIIIEGVADAKALYSEIAKATSIKPVVVLKVGSSELANYLAMTHTGAMVGSSAIWGAAMKQSGAIPVSSATEFVVACKAFSISSVPSGGRLSLLTHTAGPSILALDILLERGCALPPLSDRAKTKIKAIIGEDAPVAFKNPLDLTGKGINAENFASSARALLEEDSTDILMAIYQLGKNFRPPTKELIEMKRDFKKPIVACYLECCAKVREEARSLEENGIPVFSSSEEAAMAAGFLLKRSVALKRGDGSERSN